MSVEQSHKFICGVKVDAIHFMERGGILFNPKKDQSQEFMNLIYKVESKKSSCGSNFVVECLSDNQNINNETDPLLQEHVINSVIVGMPVLGYENEAFLIEGGKAIDMEALLKEVGEKLFWLTPEKAKLFTFQGD